LYNNIFTDSQSLLFEGVQGVRHEVLVLPPSVDAPRLARKATQVWLAEADLDEFEEVAALVVSELVANAVMHARTPLELSFTAEGRSFEVGVSDSDRRPPRLVRRLEAASPEDRSLPTRGRGLGLVEVLADDWGVVDTGSGKRVWARWSADEGSERQA
jgi:anti-sigma regulatory factor (Ser/Thr protein kinase)